MRTFRYILSLLAATLVLLAQPAMAQAPETVSYTHLVFFTENQSSVNPHNQLSFDQSAQIIISHVTEGVKIAEKALLPKAVISFIRTHHGRGKAKYFYNSFKNQYPDVYKRQLSCVMDNGPERR